MKTLNKTNILEILAKFEKFQTTISAPCGECVGCSCHNSNYEPETAVHFGQKWEMCCGENQYYYLYEYTVSDGGTCYKPYVKKLVFFDKLTGEPVFKKVKSLPSDLNTCKLK